MVNSDQSPPADDDHRVLEFRRGAAGPANKSRSPVEDLAKFERSDDGDDYQHRMMVNVIAFLFVAGLIAAGLWLADTMAQMRKNQDCVLSGRRGCSPVEVIKERW